MANHLASSLAGPRRWAIIDVPALSDNASLIEGPLDLRANAYGHDLELVLSAVQTPRDVFVSTAAELELAKRMGFFPRIPTAQDAELVAGTAEQLFLGTAGGVMTLSGEIINLKDVPAETPVSYGYTFRTDQPSTLALIALGYADGVPRRASNRGSAVVGSHPGVIAGRIAMDQLVICLEPGSYALNSQAVLFGSDDGAHSLDEWAALVGLDPLVITMGLGSRIQRIPNEAA